MNKQLKEKREEYDEMKGCISTDIPPLKSMASRTTIMSCETWATHEDIFSLSLSPEHFDK